MLVQIDNPKPAVSWLKRLRKKTTKAVTANENCGTGAGGFQPGNDCAKGGGTSSPAFKRWFAGSKVVDANGKPLVVYHGTKGTFDAFLTDLPEEKDWGMLDRALGAHFAEDPDVTDVFAIGQYARPSDYSVADNPEYSWYRDREGLKYDGVEVLITTDADGRETVVPYDREKHGGTWSIRDRHGDNARLAIVPPGGQVYPVHLSIKNPLTVEPDGRESDQAAVGRVVGGLVLGKDRDLFIGALASTGRGAEEAGHLWDALSKGQKSSRPEHEHYSTFEDVARNFTGILNGRDNALRAKAILKGMGYDGILYRNTSQNEVKGDDNARTWIAFDPSQIKSVGNRGTYIAEDKRVLNAGDNCGTGAGGFQPGNTCAAGVGNVPLSSFKYHDENDDFLYHITPFAEKIIETGELKSGRQQSMDQGFYRQYSKGKVFFTERSRVKWWADRIEQHLEAQHDDPPALSVVRVPRALLAGKLKDDEVGNRDDLTGRGGSYYIEGKASLTGNALATNRWEALSSSRQLEAFKEWVKKQIILDLLPSDTDDSWLGAYIKFAYQRGLARVFEDMRPQDDKTLDFYKGTKQEFLKSAFGRPVSQERVKLLTARTYNDLQGITDAMSAKLSRVLTDGMIQGKSPRDVARDIDKEIDGIGRARALTMARTETIRAHAEGQLDAMEAQGIDEAGVAVEWSTSEMGVTAKGNPSPCDRCAPMAGVVLKVKESHGLIPLHPNAVFEGSTFIPYGDAHEIVRARYDGPAIVLRATDGLREYRTTIGPNHPMFSRLGLVKAAQLREGDEILYDRRHDPSFSSDVDHEQIPAIENVFESLLGDIANIHIASASSDLHGDRVFCQGEVEAIRPARSLLLVWDTLGVEQLRKENFVWADAESSLTSSDSPLSFSRRRIRRAASRLVSAGDNSRAFGSRHLREPELGGVALASPGNAGVSKASIHDTARASELFGNRLDRQPSVVHRRDLLGRDIEHGPFLWLKVTEVVESHFSGWAFDATTASSLYCNSGFVVKNCMCSWIPANVGEDTKDQIRTKSRIQKAIQASLDAEGVEEGDESDWEGQDLKLDKDRPKPLE